MGTQWQHEDDWMAEIALRTQKLIATLGGLTRDEAIQRLAGFLAAAELMAECNEAMRKAKDQLIHGLLTQPDETITALEKSNFELNVPDDSIDPFNLALQGYKIETKKATKRGKVASNALHSKPGGSREKREAIRLMWASGKFDSRDLCAEQECAGLSMSISTARKALRNTPEPA